MDFPADQPVRTVARCMGVVHGVILIASSLAIGGVAWFALDRIGDAADRQEVVIEGLPAMAIDHPPRVALFALVPLICGILMIVTRAHKWIWFVLGMSCLIVLAGLVLYCFLSLLGPLYTPQEI